MWYSSKLGILLLLLQGCSSEHQIVGSVLHHTGSILVRGFDSDCHSPSGPGAPLALEVNSDGNFALRISSKGPSCLALESPDSKITFLVPSGTRSVGRIDDWLSLRLRASSVSEGDSTHLFSYRTLEVSTVLRESFVAESLHLMAIDSAQNSRFSNPRFVNGTPVEPQISELPFHWRLIAHGKARCGDVDCSVQASVQSDLMPGGGRLPVHVCRHQEVCTENVGDALQDDEALLVLNRPSYVRLLVVEGLSQAEMLTFRLLGVDGIWRDARPPRTEAGIEPTVFSVYSSAPVTQFRIGGLPAQAKLSLVP